MTPVDQTKFLSKGERGNCLAACLASIFETSIGNIPVLEELPKNLWAKSLQKWSETQGFSVSKVSPDQHGDRHYIAVGKSSRGNLHATVGFEGKIVHDPDVYRNGLESVLYLFTFARLPYCSPRPFTGE